jgi:spermidine/putrescine transport system substrate-binding protein
MKRHYLACLIMLLFLPCFAVAEEKVLNIYAWANEIPDFVVHEFEKETGIKVHLATYESNEIMYSKLRTLKRQTYDLVQPSSYFVDRMRRQNMLTPLDKTKLPNWRYLNPEFLHPSYDPESKFSVPYVWGATGMFYNDQYFPKNSVPKWTDLWNEKYKDQLLLLDDTREVFSMALMSLGYSANDSDPEHIKKAFLKLKELMPNVKVFASDIVVAMIADEDATIGMAWNGDIFKAQLENPHIHFVYPEEGFTIWVDNFVIPKNAPHRDAAHRFINFTLRPDIAKEIVFAIRYGTANLAAQNALPEDIRKNPLIYPSHEVLRRGQFQRDLNEHTLELYEQYWDELKMSG